MFLYKERGEGGMNGERVYVVLCCVVWVWCDGDVMCVYMCLSDV